MICDKNFKINRHRKEIAVPASILDSNEILRDEALYWMGLSKQENWKKLEK